MLFTSILPFHLTSDSTIAPFATLKSYNNGSTVPSLCFTLWNIDNDMTSLMAPSLMLAHTRTTLHCGPRNRTWCMKGLIISSFSVFLFAPMLNKSTISNSEVFVVTGEDVSVVPDGSSHCPVSLFQVIKAVPSLMAHSLFPVLVLPAM